MLPKQYVLSQQDYFVTPKIEWSEKRKQFEMHTYYALPYPLFMHGLMLHHKKKNKYDVSLQFAL